MTIPLTVLLCSLVLEMMTTIISFCTPLLMKGHLSLSLSHEDGHLDNPSSTQINSGAAECQRDRHLDQEAY